MRLFTVLLSNIPQISQKQLDLGFVDPIVSKLSACIRAAFFLSHGIRRDTTMYLLVKDGNYMVKFVGAELKYLGPDIRSIAFLLMKTQKGLEGSNKNRNILSKRGVYIHQNNSSLIKTLRNINVGQVILPGINGKNIEEVIREGSVNFVVSVEYPVLDFIRSQLIDQEVKEVFFREIYMIDSFIITVHNYLDSLRGNDSNGNN